MADARREASDNLLDDICDKHGTTPGGLAEMDQDKLVEWAKELLPARGRREFQVPMFRKMLEEYIADYT